jgi:hypothetical protein
VPVPSQLWTFVVNHPAWSVLVVLAVVAGSVVVGIVDDAAAGIGVATLLVVALSLATYYGQLIAMLEAVRASTAQRKLQSMLAVTELLQKDEQRRSRGQLLEVTKAYRLSGGSPPNATDPVYREHADNIGHVMQTLGYYTRKGLFEKELVLENWCHAVVTCWKAAWPLVESRRAHEGWAVWGDFEWLNTEAQAYLRAEAEGTDVERQAHLDDAWKAHHWEPPA